MDENSYTTISDHDLARLCEAKALLENPGFPARVANVIGRPIEKAFQSLPEGWSITIHKATQAALFKALNVAVETIDSTRAGRSSNLLHKVLAGASGGIGGAFGLAALPFELPVSTTIMLRSIADIARSEGHFLNNIETRLACLEVFALGGTSKADDAAENAYWAVRMALAKSVSDAVSYLARRKLVEESAPAVVRFIAAIAARFGVVVSQQAAAKAVPVVGAAAGSVVNVLFMEHFQNMARGHFIVKRLEAVYGTELVRRVYEAIPGRASSGGE